MATFVELTAHNDANGSGYWGSGIFGNHYVAILGQTNTSYKGWVYFAGGSIPPGSVITSAHVELEAQNNQSNTTCNVTCYFVNNGNASPPTSEAEADGLSLTSVVNWSSIGAWTDSSKYDTPDLASLLQAVVNQSNYTSGNNILFIFKDNGSSTNAVRYGYGGTSALSDIDKAKLHLYYDAAPTFAMSGQVTRFGTGIDGVTITVSGVGTTSTAGGGLWSKDVPYNWTGTLTPSKTGETFTPTSLTHDSPTQANEANQDFSMDMYVIPAASVAYTTITPTYEHKTNINIVNIAYTAYVPSRNFYNISTAGITYSMLEPVYSTSYVDVRSRFNMNAIGERISLKFQNVESMDIVLDDVGFTVTELYRRDGTKLNAKGNRISLKFQNNTAAEEFELQYIKLLEEVYEHQVGTKLNVLGNHLSFKFQNNTADVPFELQYVKPVIEIYENQ